MGAFMANVKHPLFSLAARGSVGNSLSFSERQGQSIAEKKPVLPYFLTLPVQYQRWLYQDYAYLWTQQSLATKLLYRTGGIRHHLTGFQYWMKYHLTFLPDIAAWWKLDEKTGTIAYDSSRNANHGTIIGASPATGPIDDAKYFDGLNDYLSFPSSPTLELGTSPWTIELFTNPSRGGDYFLHKGGDNLATPGIKCLFFGVPPKPRIYIRDGVAQNIFTINQAIPLDSWSHVAFTWDGTDTAQGFVDGLYVNEQIQAVGSITNPAYPLHLGRVGPSWHKGYIDHLIIETRVLNPTEILRHSLRRYP